MTVRELHEYECDLCGEKLLHEGSQFPPHWSRVERPHPYLDRTFIQYEVCTACTAEIKTWKAPPSSEEAPT